MRALIEYNYLKNNYSEDLKTQINAYYTAGYQVLIWYKYKWTGKYEYLTTDQLLAILKFLRDNDINNHGLLLNFDENVFETNLLLTSDVFIPART